MTTVLITGADGFIARHLVMFLKEAGFTTLGNALKPEPIQGYDRTFIANLGDSLGRVVEQEKIDAIVHCANASGKDEYRLNVAGTSLWMEEGQSRGVPLQIFLSSLSASPHALSDYGRAKYLLEEMFIQNGQVVFKLGLVVGNGGMFGRMVETLHRSKIVPLLDSGKTNTYLVSLTNLCHVITESIRKNGEGLTARAWYFQQPEPYTLREVMQAIRRHYRLTNLFIPVPGKPVLWLVVLLEKLGWKGLPVSSANILGVIQSRNESYPSDFASFGLPAKSLDELVADAAREALS